MLASTNSDPIHISTGLLYSGIAANGESKGKKYNEIATNMMFDYVAVLLDEPGAGTPEEGVGTFVNSEGDEQQIEVARLAEGIDCTRDGLINKTKFFFINASNFSFDDISSAISDNLREGDSEDKWLWPETVWPDSFIYRNDTKYLKQKYLIDDDGKAVFVGEPVEVVRKTVDDVIKAGDWVVAFHPTLDGAGYDDCTAKLILMYAAALMATSSGARRIKSQGAPSGASRSFDYDADSITWLRDSLARLDTSGCTGELPISAGNSVGLFMVVGGC